MLQNRSSSSRSAFTRPLSRAVCEPCHGQAEDLALIKGVLSTSCNPYVLVDFNGTSQRTQTQRTLRVVRSLSSLVGSSEEQHPDLE